MKQFLIFLFAAFSLIACQKKPVQRTTIIEINADPQPAISRTVNDINRNVGSTTSRIPNPPVQ